MIFKLRGTIEDKFPESLIVNLGMICLEVQTPSNLINQKQVGEQIELYTHLYARENEFELFGFPGQPERMMFNSLIEISGIGPKTALGVLSQNTVTEIRDAVTNNQTGVFTAVSGIGKKNANRIVLELKSRFEQSDEFDFAFLEDDEEASQAVSALQNLGYKQREAKEALAKVDSELSLEDKIKKALQILAKK